MPQVALPRLAARAVDALKRRVFQRQLHRLVVVDMTVPLVTLGSAWGGWDIPSGALGDDPVCYCVGAGGDVSFDLALLRDAGATVRCIDPNQEFGDDALRQAQHDPRFTFHRTALAAHDGVLTLHRSFDPNSGTASAENIYRTGATFEVPATTLPTLMADVGDERVDLLKIDIEGSEYAVLEALDPVALGIDVICVEFHHTSRASRAARIVRALAPHYGVVHVSDRSDVTLARRPN